MRRDEFADERLPGAKNFAFLQTFLQPELLHHPGQKFRGRLRAIGSRRIERQASPFGDDGAAKRRSHENAVKRGPPIQYFRRMLLGRIFSSVRYFATVRRAIGMPR